MCQRQGHAHLADAADLLLGAARGEPAGHADVQGVHPRVVMEILGHSQISLTMNTYSHVIPDLGHDAARLMNDLITGLPESEK